MEAPEAPDPKWAPKETLQNELREVKRPVNNINNILSEERGALWCFNLSFFPLASLLCSFCRNMWSLSVSPLTETKKSCLLLLNSSSSTPGPNPHLKWLSKELKASSQRSQEGLFKLTPTQQPEAYAAEWLKAKVANAKFEENHLKCFFRRVHLEPVYSGVL